MRKKIEESEKKGTLATSCPPPAPGRRRRRGLHLTRGIRFHRTRGRHIVAASISISDAEIASTEQLRPNLRHTHSITYMENEEHDEYLRVVNKTFRSEWEGYEFYYKYVKIKGFGVRKEEVKYLSGTRTRFRRRYMCFKEVNHTLANFERPDPKRTPKALTRCGCLARFDIEMSATTSEWFVKDFVDNHNHPLTKAMLLTMEHAAGGPERVGFISWDLYNFVAEYKKKKIEGRDAELQQKGNDADFYYRYDTIF